MLMFKILLSVAEIFLTRSKVNLFCTDGGEVSGGVVVVNIE